MFSHPFNLVFWNWQPSTSIDEYLGKYKNNTEYFLQCFPFQQPYVYYLVAYPAEKCTMYKYACIMCILNNIQARACERAIDWVIQWSIDKHFSWNLLNIYYVFTSFQVIAIQILYDNPFETPERLFETDWAWDIHFGKEFLWKWLTTWCRRMWYMNSCVGFAGGLFWLCIYCAADVAASNAGSIFFSGLGAWNKWARSVYK